MATNKIYLSVLLLLLPFLDFQESCCEIAEANQMALENIIQNFDNTKETICTGPFQTGSSRTGWWTGWTPVFTSNVATTTGNWVNVGTAVTSPSCLTDLTFDIDFGGHYFLQRRNRVRFWIDYQLLVNGAAVLVRTYEIYHHHDETQDINPDVITPIQYEIENIGDTEDFRANIPAGATVQVQARTRYQVVSAQSSAYFRYLGGLRSNTTYHFTPRNLLIQ